MPQLPQKRAPLGSSAPHWVQWAVPRRVPQLAQNFSDPTGLSHVGQTVRRADV